jgi:hypothetical protein
MADLYRAYASEVHDQLDYSAAWLPGADVALGDTMVEQDGVFHREGGTPTGISFDTRTDKASDDQFSFQSQSGVDIHFKAAGEVPSGGLFQAIGKADAGAALDFSSANAVVFALHDVYVDRVENVGKLKSDLLGMIFEGQFHEENAVVVEVVRAGSGTIVVSTSNSAKVEIRAKANIGQLTDLGNAELGLGLARYKDVGVNIVANNDLTPVFRVIRFKQTIWDKLRGMKGDFNYGLRELETLDIGPEDAFEPDSHAVLTG